jgi:hypothetical protein
VALSLYVHEMIFETMPTSWLSIAQSLLSRSPKDTGVLWAMSIDLIKEIWRPLLINHCSLLTKPPCPWGSDWAKTEQCSITMLASFSTIEQKMAMGN